MLETLITLHFIIYFDTNIHRNIKTIHFCKKKTQTDNLFNSVFYVSRLSLLHAPMSRNNPRKTLKRLRAKFLIAWRSLGVKASETCSQTLEYVLRCPLQGVTVQVYSGVWNVTMYVFHRSIFKLWFPYTVSRIFVCLIS